MPTKLSIPQRSRFLFHDFLQVIIGAFVLAVPVGFTEETWTLGQSLPILNTVILILLTLFFIAIFTFFHYHKEHIHANPGDHLLELTKRVLVTYVFSFIIVAVLLAIIQVTPWATDSLTAFRTTVIVTFPSAIGAVISDTIK